MAQTQQHNRIILENNCVQNDTRVGAKQVPKVARTIILEELCWPKLRMDNYVPLMEISCPKVNLGAHRWITMET
jgi:hypothetical protein